VEREKKEKNKENNALVKKSNVMRTEFDYNRNKLDDLKNDLSREQDLAEIKRGRLNE
jgi:hypothetical protein